MISPCIILWKNTQSGKVGVINGPDSDDPHVFASEDAAEAFANASKLLQAFPYQIVPLEF